MNHRIAIALSGGIDSLAAAALLKDAGHHVIGFHFLSGYETDSRCDAWTPDGRAGRESNLTHLVSDLSDQLHIAVHVIDLRSEFERHVVDYFSETYQSGQTPNPCLVCNPAIKFDALYQKAREFDADIMATGHYARILPGADGRMRLLCGIDPVKDQSYFLARLTQAQLSFARLPLGDFTKEQARALVRQKGLVPAVAQESQDICFIKNGSYGDFLKNRPGFSPEPGPIVNLDGDPVGTHQGLHLFTIGQRRGINLPAAAPYYVVRIEPAENRLVVGQKEDLAASGCRVTQINWIALPPEKTIPVRVRVRYRHRAVPARLHPLDGHRAEIAFETPQTAVTPGQGAVFYDGNEVLGGGWIE